MDSCAAEVGLLKKKPCGQPGTAKCMNCEISLCSKHAVPELNARKARTGKFLCQECDKAQRAAEKRMGAVEGEAMAMKPPEPAKPAKPAAAAPAAKTAAPAAKPATPAAKPAAPAVKPAAAPAAKAAEKPKEPAHDDVDAPLEFTPSKKQ